MKELQLKEATGWIGDWQKNVKAEISSLPNFIAGFMLQYRMAEYIFSSIYQTIDEMWYNKEYQGEQFAINAAIMSRC